MKYILSICTIFVSLTLFGEESAQNDWMNHWTAAIFYTQTQQFDSAIQEFTHAIAKSQNPSSDNLFLYNGRGRIYELAGDPIEAIKDFSCVIEHPHVKNDDLILALWGRSACYLASEDFENFDLDFESIKELDPWFPKVESNEHFIVIRNFDSSDMSDAIRESFGNIFIESGMCDTPADITYPDTNICIIRKSCLVDTEDFSKQSCKACGFNTDLRRIRDDEEVPPANEFPGKRVPPADEIPGERVPPADQIPGERVPPADELPPGKQVRPEEFPTEERILKNCIFWCNRVFLTSRKLCHTFFPNRKCLKPCIAYIEVLRKNCHHCCKHGRSYRRCVRPFRHFTRHLPCNP